MADDKQHSTRWKGPRTQALIRVPDSHYKVYERLAAEAGLPLGDYLTLRLAEGHDLDLPAYLTRDRNQGTLHMAG